MALVVQRSAQLVRHVLCVGEVSFLAALALEADLDVCYWDDDPLSVVGLGVLHQVEVVGGDVELAFAGDGCDKELVPVELLAVAADGDLDLEMSRKKLQQTGAIKQFII